MGFFGGSGGMFGRRRWGDSLETQYADALDVRMETIETSTQARATETTSLMSGMLGTDEQFSGTMDYQGLDPRVSDYLGRFSMDETYMSSVMEGYRGSDPWMERANTLLGESNILAEQAEAAARAGDYEEATRLKDLAFSPLENFRGAVTNERSGRFGGGRGGRRGRWGRDETVEAFDVEGNPITELFDSEGNIIPDAFSSRTSPFKNLFGRSRMGQQQYWTKLGAGFEYTLDPEIAAAVNMSTPTALQIGRMGQEAAQYADVESPFYQAQMSKVMGNFDELLNRYKDLGRQEIAVRERELLAQVQMLGTSRGAAQGAYAQETLRAHTQAYTQNMLNQLYAGLESEISTIRGEATNYLSEFGENLGLYAEHLGGQLIAGSPNAAVLQQGITARDLELALNDADFDRVIEAALEGRMEQESILNAVRQEDFLQGLGTLGALGSEIYST